MFDLKSFVHGLNIFNASKGSAPEEVFMPDNLPQQIAEAGAQRRYSNAAYAAEEEANRARNAEKRERRRVVAVGAMVGADRLALLRTLSFIEKRWREGAERDQVFKEAERVRQAEFDEAVADFSVMDRFKAAMEDMPDDVNEGRRVLVSETPVLDRGRRVPSRPR